MKPPFNDKYLKFIYAFKNILDEDHDHEMLNKIKDDICDLIFSMGCKPMTREMFYELLVFIRDDEDNIIKECNKLLAFILNFTDMDIYRLDFKKYQLLDSNMEHTYSLLYANQIPELKNVFRDENHNQLFFYCPELMLDIFIKNKIIKQQFAGF